jgi:sulfur relay (sulfurtransferase) DsrC/TusE family protein
LIAIQKKRKRKLLRMPKTYSDYKRELRENREEIELTGSNKMYWRNLAKLIGEEKANQRRAQAIAKQGKIKCATKEGVVVEVDKNRELLEGAS